MKSKTVEITKSENITTKYIGSYSHNTCEPKIPKLDYVSLDILLEYLKAENINVDYKTSEKSLKYNSFTYNLRLKEEVTENYTLESVKLKAKGLEIIIDNINSTEIPEIFGGKATHNSGIRFILKYNGNNSIEGTNLIENVSSVIKSAFKEYMFKEVNELKRKIESIVKKHIENNNYKNNKN